MNHTLPAGSPSHLSLRERSLAACERARQICDHSALLLETSVAIREDRLTTLCAWCGRHRLDDRWVTVSRTPTFAVWGHLEVSHGICPDCVAALKESGRSV